METLAGYLNFIRRRQGARAWVGLRPQVPPDQLVAAIAAQVGYSNGPSQQNMLAVDRAAAAQVLAFLATTDLAYGSYGPAREGPRQMAVEALRDLGTGAVFLTNTADWVRGSPVSIISGGFSDATFEAGMIGYDDETAFMFWVEEED